MLAMICASTRKPVAMSESLAHSFSAWYVRIKPKPSVCTSKPASCRSAIPAAAYEWGARVSASELQHP